MSTTLSILDRVPPNDINAERGIIAACILDPSQVDRVGPIIAGSDFYNREFGQLFDAIVTIHHAGINVSDFHLLISGARRLEVPEEVLSPAFFAECSGNSLATSAPFYAKSIRRCAALREVIHLGSDMVRRAYEGDAEPADIAALADARIQTIGQRQPAQVRSVAAIAEDAINDLIDEYSKPKQRGLMFGLSTIDEAAGAMIAGELTILAARPGVGKTTLAWQIAVHNARRDRRALFVSLEMRDRELILRELCGRAKVNSRLTRSGELNADELRALNDAKESLGGVVLEVWAPAAATLSQIRGVAKYVKATGGLQLLAVDYLGLIRPEAEDRSRPRFEQVSRISAGLKQLAKELDVPLLCCCQLNREADGAQPRLSNLRESGSIEQDADVVLFLHRAETVKGADGQKVQFIIAKHRHSQIGAVELEFRPAETRFTNPHEF